MARWTISSRIEIRGAGGIFARRRRRRVDLRVGTAGYNFADHSISDDVAEQTRQSLATISAALEKAGASLKDIVRVRVYVSEREHVPAVSKVLGETFSDPRPTNTTIVCGFAMPEMKVELEVTALRRG